MMDALEFGRQRRRMCNSIKCVDCKLFGNGCQLGEDYATEEDDARVIEAVDKWAAEHPEETRQSNFLKMFPNAQLDVNGVLRVCPKYVDEEKSCSHGDIKCSECRRGHWLSPLEG